MEAIVNKSFTAVSLRRGIATHPCSLLVLDGKEGLECEIRRVSEGGKVNRKGRILIFLCCQIPTIIFSTLRTEPS